MQNDPINNVGIPGNKKGMADTTYIANKRVRKVKQHLRKKKNGVSVVKQHMRKPHNGTVLGVPCHLVKHKKKDHYTAHFDKGGKRVHHRTHVHFNFEKW